jgi:hypothetical protein
MSQLMLQLGNLFEQLLFDVFGHSFSVAVGIDREATGVHEAACAFFRLVGADAVRPVSKFCTG